MVHLSDVVVMKVSNTVLKHKHATRNTLARNRMLARLAETAKQGALLATHDNTELMWLRRHVGTDDIAEPEPYLFCFQHDWDALTPAERALRTIKGLAKFHPDWAFWGYDAALIWGLEVPNDLLGPRFLVKTCCSVTLSGGCRLLRPQIAGALERVDGVPGVVTLIVLPAYDPMQPDQPTPDKEMLRRVCAWLEPRRLVTTELYVTPPQYVRLSCSVAVEPDAGAGEETLRRHIELALRQHLAPLPPYGPDGKGWPFGRDVRDRDIEAATLRVQGVRLVNEVLVVGEEISRTGVRTAVEETVTLLPWQLPVLLEVKVAIGADATAEALPPLDTEADPTPVTTMPVPVGKEEC